jgi:hypothetical protein
VPLTLGKLAGKTATASFEYAGETVTFRYHPSRYTPALLSQLVDVAGLADYTPDKINAKLAAEGPGALGGLAGSMDAIADVLATLLEPGGWDLTDEATGAPYPTDRESLRQLPFDFLAEVLGAVSDEMTPATPGKV